MKKYIIRSAYVFMVATTVVSCRKNLLDTQPQTRISEDVAFSTPEKILAQVNNLYSKVQVAGFYGGRHILFNEQRGEEFSQNDPNSSVGASIWGQNALSNDNLVNTLWSAAYKAINSANIVIANVRSTSVVASPLREQYVAEAKFVRAFSYLALVQTFAQPYAKNNGASPGLPLRLNAETSDGNNDLARSTVAEVYAQIIKDLDDAEKDLPDYQGSAALNTSRAHKATAIALKTRTYLIKGDYASVVTEAKKLVPDAAPYQYTAGSTTHRLETNIATVFGGAYTGVEALFFIPFNNVDAPDVQSALGANYLGAVVLSLNPAGIVTNTALSGTASVDARKGLITTKNSQKVITKFTKTGSPYTDYIPAVRYAEVLLNYAEAAAETNDLVKATALLNAVRKRSDASYAFPSTDTDTKAALVTTILTERRIELLGEGFRTPDLQRRLQTLPAKSGAAGSAPAVASTAANYIWPIPSDEIATNKLIQP
ncbi:MAG: RagB/SusD family nutrient uptake outer membrane protein [Chitinophagaceae bacterium]